MYSRSKQNTTIDKEFTKALEKNTDLQDERDLLRTELAINQLRLGFGKCQKN